MDAAWVYQAGEPLQCAGAARSNSLPIDDIVGWLIREHPGASERDILGMVQTIYMRDYKIAPASSEFHSYKARDNTWEACPQRVECG